MADEAMVDRIARAMRALGGEAQLGDIRRIVLHELGDPNSRRSKHYQTVSLTIHQHSEGRGRDIFQKVGEGRYRLTMKDPILG
jgi:hypothetical protein